MSGFKAPALESILADALSKIRIPTFVATYPGPSRIRFANPALATALACRVEDLVDRPLEDVFSGAKFCGNTWLHIEEAFKDNQSFSLLEHLDKDDELHAAREILIAPIAVSSGTTGHMVGTVRDITESLRHRHVMDDAHRRLGIYLDIARISLWQTDLIAQKTHYDDLFFQFLGYEPGEIEPDWPWWIDNVDPTYQSIVSMRLRDAVEGFKSVFEVEYPIRGKDGSWVWVWSRGKVVARDENGQATRLYGVLINTTAYHEQTASQARSEQVIKMLVGGGTVALWHRDLGTGEMQIDSHYFKMLGFDVDQVPDRAVWWHKHLGPAQSETVIRRIDDYLYGEVPGVVVELRVVDSAGNDRWMLMRGETVSRSETGRPTQIAGLFQDITDLKRAQERLVESEDHMRRVLNAVPDIIAEIDTLGALRYVNHASAWLAEEKKSSANIFDWIPADAAKTVSDSLAMVRATGKMTSTEAQFVDPGKELRKFALRMMPLPPKDGDERFLCVATDLTEQIAATQAAALSEQRMRWLWDNVPDIVAHLDLDGRVIYINKVLTGFTVDDVIGTKAEDWFPAKAVHAHRKAMDDAKRTGIVQQFETWFEKDVEKRIWFNIRMIPLLADGEVAGFLSITADITTTKEAELARRRYEGQLRQQQKLESIGVLAAGVAHEINNPIQGIMNMAELMLMMTEDEQLKSNAGSIVRECQRVATIVRNMLTFSRQGAQEFIQADLRKMIDETLSLVKILIKRDNVELRTELPDELPPVVCRPQQVQQVLMNLITNARDAVNSRFGDSRDVKRVVLVVKLAASGESENEDLVSLEVTDNGVGIKKDALHHIFDPFYTTKGEAGTGLGLAISHGIARDHGGRLVCKSSPGMFTTFTLELPLAGPAKSQLQRTRTAI
ncbi:MAG: PAS domain-containing protein [Deltaproteobacteria bacterium]|nr:PAS domain-containing protein [Deltaproteobacteria bacterium]MCB9488652.1 PAS domain-containing protein [Deltaproteobacteria bacterium]